MNEQARAELKNEEQIQLEEINDNDEWLENYSVLNKEQVVPLVNKREGGEEIAELEKMIELFETEHSLTALHSIINLAKEESRRHPVREPARVDLFKISKKLNTLRKETKISPEKSDEFQEKWLRLYRAVGVIDDNSKVDHKRLLDIQ